MFSLRFVGWCLVWGFVFLMLISCHLKIPCLSERLSWLEQGADNGSDVGSVPLWAIHPRLGLHNPCGTLPTQTVLWFCEEQIRGFAVKSD